MYYKWVEYCKKNNGIIRYFYNWYIALCIYKSKQFDSNYYINTYNLDADRKKVKLARKLKRSNIKIFHIIGKVLLHPIRHYIWNGVYENKNPNSTFNTSVYINRNFDVAFSKINPFYHYIKFGISENRKYSIDLDYVMGANNFTNIELEIIEEYNFFDSSYYLEKNIDVKESSIDPLYHFCYFGWKEMRDPYEGYNIKKYITENDFIKKFKINPLVYSCIVESNKTENTIFKRNNQIVFIGHEAEITGAPVILYDIINWFEMQTAYKTKVILIRGGFIEKKYKDLTCTYIIDQNIEKRIIKSQLNDFIDSNNFDNTILFLNTIVSVKIQKFFNIEKYKKIFYIHELRKTLEAFSNDVKQMKLYDCPIICASKSVEEVLEKEYKIKKENLNTVHAFIKKADITKLKAPNIDIEFESYDNILYGCGTVYWRKNPLGFIRIAEKILKKEPNTLFIWMGIGEELSECLDYITRKKLEQNIKFIGIVNNPREYFNIGDVFLLTAIEDPFPLVCLEAAECKLPIVCYENSGGMPSFVGKEAGIVVEYNDEEKYANEVINLLKNVSLKKQLGTAAREKVLLKHTVDNSMQLIKKIIDDTICIDPVISVIVPNYNHSNYLEERLCSIKNQKYQDMQIILLDDKSTDNSLCILKEFNENNVNSILISNETNSGNVFMQWAKGLKYAKGDYIWMAESDDTANDDFLKTLILKFLNDDVVISYSNSNIINGEGIFQNTYDKVNWLTDLDEKKWSKDYIVRGKDEFEEALAIKCTIPNISATLIKNEYFISSLEESSNYSKAGDWIFYSFLVRYGKVAYTSKALNYHRRHSGTVTSTEGDELGVSEIYKIHKFYVDNFYISKDTKQKMIDFIKKEYEIYKDRNSVKKEFDKLYNSLYIESAEEKKKTILFQHGLNFGKGGAEKMLITTANALYERGINVEVVNRTYSNNPLPYPLNININLINIDLEENINEYYNYNEIKYAIIYSIGHNDLKNIEQFEELGAKTILSLHNEPNFFDDILGKEIHNKMINNVNYAIALQNSYKYEYENRGFENIKVIPNFVKKPKIYGIKDELMNKKFIFSAGRLVEQKQQWILIEAFSELAIEFKDLNLVIAGEGHLREKLEKQIDDLGLNNRVFLIGEVNNIGDYYKGCEIFVLPSLFEGFALVVLEAANFNKPIVIFKDCKPYGEIFKDKDEIILVENMKCTDLVKGIKNGLEKSRNKDFSTENITFQYSEKNIISKWIELIC